MPELPDVENFKQYFEKTSLQKKIADVRAPEKNLIKKAVFSDFKKELKGKKFTKAERRGKYLIANLNSGKKKVVFHFGMTGELAHVKEGKEKPSFCKVEFEFETGDILCWINKRKLGKVFLVKEISEIDALKEMGPEPLELSGKEFLNLLSQNEERQIKAFFLDQSAIAGIGNEYSDEILFRTGISPKREIKDINKKERKELFENMRKILKEAVKVGPPAGEFGKEWLLSHRTASDMKCPKNPKHNLKKETVAGRSAVYCPEHQR